MERTTTARKRPINRQVRDAPPPPQAERGHGRTQSREVGKAGDNSSLISIYRCDLEMRIAEVLYSDHFADHQRFIGGTDHDWLPQDEAEAVMALKWRAFREKRTIRDTMPLSLEGKLRTFRIAAFPEREGSSFSITVVATEILDADEWLRMLDLPYVSSQEPEMPRFGLVRMDNTTRTLLGPVRDVHLSGTEWRLVRYLSNAHGGVVSHEQLLSAIWGSGYSNAHHLLHDAVSRLRQRFHAAGMSKSPIETVHGVGYRLKEEGEVF